MGPILRSLVGLAVTRYASRSVPRAALVAGGIIVKALIDRRRARHAPGMQPPKTPHRRTGKGATR